MIWYVISNANELSLLHPTCGWYLFGISNDFFPWEKLLWSLYEGKNEKENKGRFFEKWCLGVP